MFGFHRCVLFVARCSFGLLGANFVVFVALFGFASNSNGLDAYFVNARGSFECPLNDISTFDPPSPTCIELFDVSYKLHAYSLYNARRSTGIHLAALYDRNMALLIEFAAGVFSVPLFCAVAIFASTGQGSFDQLEAFASPVGDMIFTGTAAIFEVLLFLASIIKMVELV